jgi:hypothetical protein
MGFNTTVVVMNDALSDIANDPDFGKNLADAVSRSCLGDQVDVPAYSYRRNGYDKGWTGVYCNAATVIETHHADQTTLVAVGGNCGTNLGTFWPYGEGTLEERMLRELADKLGYRLVKKAPKKVRVMKEAIPQLVR